MSSAPPPVFIVPPPPPNQPSKPHWASVTVIIILCGFLFVLLCAMLLGVGATYGQTHARKRVGRPISKGVPVSPGWAVYHIPALGLSIASCSVPVVDKRVEPVATKNQRIQEYAAYRMTRSSLTVSIVGYWLKDAHISAKALTTYVTSQMKTGQSKFQNLGTSDVQIGGYPGQVISLEIPFHKSIWVRKTAIVSIQKQVYYIQGQYVNSPNRWGERSFDYMLKTVTFD